MFDFTSNDYLNKTIGYNIKTPLQYRHTIVVINALDLLTVKSIALLSSLTEVLIHKDMYFFVWTKDDWFCLELSLLI